MKKIKEMKGETLIETLVAIVVLTISAMLLAEVSASSVRINKQVDAIDTQYRQELAVVENRNNPEPGKVTIKSSGNTYTYQVDYYGDQAGLTSYAAKAEGI